MQCFLRIFRNYSGACFGTLRYRAIPHKERLATLHAICLQISRHISQKFDDASVAQSLCGIAIE